MVRTYHELGSIRLLHTRLAAEGVTSKAGQRLSHGALFHTLQNRVYRGEVRHKGHVYPDEHGAIIDLLLWDAVQTQLAENRVQRACGSNADHPSLLAGLAYEGDTDTRLTPTHAVKAGKRYRYYVSRLTRLAFLAPDVLSAIMNGRQPAELSAASPLQECRRGLPVSWEQQREALGFR